MRKRSRARPSSRAHKGSTVYTTTTIYLLIDNAHPELGDVYKRQLGNVVVVDKSTLGLSEDVKDTELVTSFCRSASKTGNARLIVLSKDRGKGDGVMPSVIATKQVEGYDVKLVTYPATITGRVAMAMFEAVLSKAGRGVFYRASRDAKTVHASPDHRGYKLEVGASRGPTKTVNIDMRWK